METLTNNKTFVMLMSLLVPYLLAKFWAWRTEQARKRGKENVDAADEALKAGVQHVWETKVRQWKKESGVLSDERRRQAREGAINIAKGILSSKGISEKVLGGASTASMKIADIIAGLKRRKKPAE